MNSSKVVIAIGTAGLLCGCAGALPPKPLPAWAMSRPPHSTEVAAKPREGVRKRQGALRHLDAGLGTSVHSDSTGSTVKVPAGADYLNPYSKEWYAREEAVDARLRRRMRICAAC